MWSAEQLGSSREQREDGNFGAIAIASSAGNAYSMNSPDRADRGFPDSALATQYDVPALAHDDALMYRQPRAALQDTRQLDQLAVGGASSLPTGGWLAGPAPSLDGVSQHVRS